jgi:hypothetical protein
MNKSEEFVFNLCQKTFLSLWSYPSPKGKSAGKELCDLLVVCEPDVIIFSVKEIGFKKTGNVSLDWSRWLKKAIDESCKQIYGAEKWVRKATCVITKDGKEGLPFPTNNIMRVHRVAVALGGEGQTPIYFGDFGKGFIHVFDETTLQIVMRELDTISDFVKYLTDKENLYHSGGYTLFTTGREEDLLAYYLHHGRVFSDNTVIVVKDGIWDEFSMRREYLAKKAADEVSYSWDELIEIIGNDLQDGKLLAEDFETTASLTDAELAIRTMAKENRFNRRMLGKAFLEFLELTMQKKIEARLVPSLSPVTYVFLALPYEDRKYRVAVLAQRCFVARGLHPEHKTVIGIATEPYNPGGGYSLDAFYFYQENWSDEDQQELDKIKREFGHFKNMSYSYRHEDEYPQT